MTVKVSKPAINVREELADLKKPTGIAGEAMLRADTPVEQFNLISAGRRNLIINGAMQVAQRGTSATAAVNTTFSTVDRFKFFLNNANAYTTERSTGHLADTGHDTALKISVTTADTSLATGDYYSFLQPIEAQDVQQLQYGTSSAKEMTLSFWVRATKAGTQAMFVTKNDATSYNFVQEYTINQSDTWEYKTVTIPPLTASAITNDSGIGIRVGWILAYGSAYHTSTIGSWTTNTNAFSTANAVNNMDSTSNTLYLTGVQLELGKVATPFEHRSYGEELALCQRYYERWSGVGHYGSGFFEAVGYGKYFFPFKAVKRTTPTVTLSNTDWRAYWTGSTAQATSRGSQNISPESALLWVNGGGSGTDGYGTTLLGNTSDCFVEVDAEL